MFESHAGTLTVWTRTDDALLTHVAPARGDDGVAVVPMAVLEAAEGGVGDPVELEVGPKLAGEARWSDRGVPKTHPFEAILPGKQHHPPDPPDDWHAAPPDLLSALHECGRTAAKDAGRFALTRVQVKGRAGHMIGTDGKTALVWSRLDLPFADDLLVPVLPVFGARELSGERDVRLGRTPMHLVVGAGRYPDVAGVIPRDAPTVAGIDDADAAALADALPKRPGAGDDCRPVTLDLDGGVVIRARDDTTGKVEQLRLEASPSAGRPRASATSDLNPAPAPIARPHPAPGPHARGSQPGCDPELSGAAHNTHRHPHDPITRRRPIMTASATASTTNDKPPRKQLADQLDRLDRIIDCLADALPEAVADACREGARQAVKDAVVEILASPELRTLITGLAAARVAPPPGCQPELPVDDVRRHRGHCDDLVHPVPGRLPRRAGGLGRRRVRRARAECRPGRRVVHVPGGRLLHDPVAGARLHGHVRALTARTSRPKCHAGE